jgi:hypothetical protein
MLMPDSFGQLKQRKRGWKNGMYAAIDRGSLAWEPGYLPSRSLAMTENDDLQRV